jgi:hypothetical protein
MMIADVMTDDNQIIFQYDGKSFEKSTGRMLNTVVVENSL